MIILPSGASLPNNPRIGYRNIVPACALAATTEADGFPVENLKNAATYLPWKGANTGGQVLSITPPSATPVTYLGIARHNLAGTQYALQSSPNNSTWTNVVIRTPTDNSPIVHVFPQVSQPFYRIILASGSLPSIAVLYLGELLTIERRIHVGHTPAQLGRVREVSSGVSESGQYLGRVVRAETYETSVDLQNLTASHFYDDVDPFLEAAADTPFFWARRPAARPGEVVFGWMKGDPEVVNQRNNGMMQVSWKMQGIR